MKITEYTVTDPDGIHARPAGLLVKEASKFSSQITISSSGRSADAKRIFAVMGLTVKKGQTIEIKCEGSDEEEASDAIMQFLKANM